MKSYAAYFVRTEDEGSLQQVFPTQTALKDSSWFLVELQTNADPPDDAVMEGEEVLLDERFMPFEEAFFVYGDTSVDGFVYEHMVAGALVRKLVWFPMTDDWTPGWMCVEGEAEAWEATLFRREQLESHLSTVRYSDEDAGNLDAFPGHETEIRAAWATETIQKGALFPPADGTCGLLVEQSFGISRP